MKLPRLSHFVAALVTLFSLLFTQMAVAAYACPGQANATFSVSVDADPDAVDMDADEPGMCKAHCDNGKQSFDAPGAAHAAPFVAAALTGVLPDARLVEAALEGLATAAPVTRTTSPPIAIRNCCFRI